MSLISAKSKLIILFSAFALTSFSLRAEVCVEENGVTQSLKQATSHLNGNGTTKAAAGNFDQAVFDANYAYMEAQIARVEKRVLEHRLELGRLVPNGSRFSAVSLITPKSGLADSLFYESRTPLWYNQQVSLTLVELKKAEANWKELKRKVDSGEIKAEDFAKTRRTNTISVYQDYSDEMPHPEALVAAGALDREDGNSQELSSDQMKENQADASARRIAQSSSIERILPSIDYTDLTKLDYQNGIVELLRGEERRHQEVVLGSLRDEISKIADAKKESLELSADELSSISLALSERASLEFSNLAVGQSAARLRFVTSEDSRRRLRGQAIFSEQPRTKVFMADRRQREILQEMRNVVRFDPELLEALDLIAIGQKELIPPETLQRLRDVFESKEDMDGQAPEDVDEIAGLSDATQEEIWRLAQAIVEKRKTKTSPDQKLEASKEEVVSSEGLPVLEIGSSGSFFFLDQNSIDAKYQNVEEAIRDGYFDSSEAIHSPIETISQSEQSFLARVRAQEGEGRRPPADILADIPQPRCQGFSAICALVAMAQNMETEMAAYGRFEEQLSITEAWRKIFAHQYLGEIPSDDKIDSRLRDYFERRMARKITNDEYELLLKGGLSPNSIFEVLGTGVSAGWPVQGRPYLNWNETSVLENAKQVGLDSVESYKADQVSYGLIKTMVDEGLFPQVVIDSDARFLTEDWFVPVPTSPIWHVLQVVGTGRGVDPFDNQEKDFFYVIDSFVHNPMVYKVSVDKMLPMVREVKRVTGVSRRP